MNQTKVTAIQLMNQHKTSIAQALPSHVKADKLIRVISSQISQNPELGLCDPISMMSAVMRCAQLGLEPGTALSKIHLIPFNNRKKNRKEVNVIVGYQGLVELARRSGEISEIYAEAVYKNDEFKVVLGLSKDIVHVPAEGERGEFRAVYAVAKFKDGGIHFVALSKDDCEKIRTRTKYPNPIWNSDYSEMAKKTAIRRLSKLLPLSAELAIATELQAPIEINEGQDNDQVLIEAGIDIPEVPTLAQAKEIDGIKSKVVTLIEKIPEEKIKEMFKLTKQEVYDKIVDEKTANAVLSAIASMKEE